MSVTKLGWTERLANDVVTNENDRLGYRKWTSEILINSKRGILAANSCCLFGIEKDTNCGVEQAIHRPQQKRQLEPSPCG
jgi:hypothetical protein